MPPVIMYRDDGLWNLEEHRAASEYFPRITNTRMNMRRLDLVIARYCALPFYADLEGDLKSVGARLINTHAQHRFVADVQNWYPKLEGMTPETWFNLKDIPLQEPGSFVLKGETNSRKFLWNTHMFAQDRKAITAVWMRLMDDSLIGQQQIYARRYVPLHKLMDGLQGLPVTEEYRFFVAYGKILSGGFYWASHTEDLKDEGIKVPDSDDVPRDFLQKAIDAVKDEIPFFAIDVARTAEGAWIVIELNDGQMSGLSDNDPNVLYKRLAAVLAEQPAVILT